VGKHFGIEAAELKWGEYSLEYVGISTGVTESPINSGINIQFGAPSKRAKEEALDVGNSTGWIGSSMASGSETITLDCSPSQLRGLALTDAGNSAEWTCSSMDSGSENIKFSPPSAKKQNGSLSSYSGRELSDEKLDIEVSLDG
jgi:hypothetical protein